VVGLSGQNINILFKMLVLSGQHLYYFKDCGGLSGQHFKISFKKDVFLVGFVRPTLIFILKMWW